MNRPGRELTPEVGLLSSRQPSGVPPLVFRWFQAVQPELDALEVVVADVTCTPASSTSSPFRAVQAERGSIAEVSRLLQRTHTSVTQDMNELEREGLLVVTRKVLHGRSLVTETQAAANRVSLQAEIV